MYIAAKGASLTRHPGPADTDAITSIHSAMSVEQSGAVILRYFVQCDVSALVIPERALTPKRADMLWKSTCFELFVRGPGKGYIEFNFTTSGDWAAYVFEDYRNGHEATFSNAPDCADHRWDEAFSLDVRVPSEWFDRVGRPPWQVGLSAVIEEIDGTKSYWALAHPPGPPDFHHPDCFALELPAPDSK